jgi:cellulose 1,4-beta-cellobiosidase
MKMDDLNSWWMSDKTFYGQEKTVDTKSPFVVVTQFVGSPVKEIKCKYVQNGKVIEKSKVNISGKYSVNSVTDAFCDQQNKPFDDSHDFKNKGGVTKLGTVLDSSMVLVLVLWRLWLNSDYPTNKAASTPGVSRGPCPTSSGTPDDMKSKSPDATVVYGNIKFGAIASIHEIESVGEVSGIAEESKVSIALPRN